MNRAQALLRDSTLWHQDTALEREEIEQAQQELEEAADKARAALRSGDPNRILAQAVICFDGISAVLDSASGNILIAKPGVSAWLDDTQLVSFVYGGCARVPAP
jgi:precorrin-3B methylase